MVILIKQKAKRKFNSAKNTPWIALGALVFSSIVIFLVVGASRSSEVQTPPSLLQIGSIYNTYLSDEQLRNLTIELSNSFGAHVLSSIDGKEPVDPQDVIAEQLEAGVLDKTLFAPIDTDALFGVEISENDVLVSDDNSEKAMLSYFGELSKILSYTKVETLNALKQGVETKDFGAYETAANLYAHAFVQAQKLIVPSFWKEIHKKELSLLAENKKAFQAIARVDTDPVLSWRAFQHLVRLGDEGITLEKEIKVKGQEFLNKN